MTSPIGAEAALLYSCHPSPYLELLIRFNNYTSHPTGPGIAGILWSLNPGFNLSIVPVVPGNCPAFDVTSICLTMHTPIPAGF